MRVDDVGRSEKGRSERRQLGRLQVIHEGLPRAVHLRSRDHQEIELLGQRHQAPEVVELGARPPGGVVAVGDDVDGGDAGAHHHLQQLLDARLAL